MVHKLTKTTYSTQVAEYIKQCILNGEFLPGEKVKELRISQELSISRAPVREALQSLINEGFVVTIPQKGKFVAKPTAKQIYDSYVVTGVLEGYMVADCRDRFRREDFEKIEAILEAMKQETESEGDIERLFELDLRFHNMLLSKTKNEILTDLTRKTSRGIIHIMFIRYWRRIFSPMEIYSRHKMLLDCLKKGDSIEIEKVFRNHYAEAGRRISSLAVDL